MDDLIKFAKVMGVVLVIVLIGIVIGTIGISGNDVVVQSPPPNAPPAQSAPSEPVPLPATRPPVLTSKPGVPATKAATAEAQQSLPPSSSVDVPLSPEAVNLITNWEQRLDDVLASEQPEPDKARQLLAIFPRAPEEGQVELAQHLSNLVPDEDYGGFGMYLTNAAMSEEVLDVLLSDALNRPDSLKLPLLVEVARNPSNPKAQEAKDLLELFLEEDYGTDWSLWRTKVDEYLKANPAE